MPGQLPAIDPLHQQLNQEVHQAKGALPLHHVEIKEPAVDVGHVTNKPATQAPSVGLQQQQGQMQGQIVGQGQGQQAPLAAALAPIVADKKPYDAASQPTVTDHLKGALQYKTAQQVHEETVARDATKSSLTSSSTTTTTTASSGAAVIDKPTFTERVQSIFSNKSAEEIHQQNKDGKVRQLEQMGAEVSADQHAQHQQINKEMMKATGTLTGMKLHHVETEEKRIDDAVVGRVLDKSGLAGDAQHQQLNKEIQRAGMPIIGKSLHHVEPVEKRIDDAPVGRVLDKKGLTSDNQHAQINKEMMRATAPIIGMKLNHVETHETRLDDAQVGRALTKQGLQPDDQHKQLNKEIQRAGLPIIGTKLHHVETVEKHGADQVGRPMQHGVPVPDQLHQQLNKQVEQAKGKVPHAHHVETIERRIDDAPVGRVLDKKGLSAASQQKQLNKEIQRASMPIIGKHLHHVEPRVTHLSDEVGHPMAHGARVPDETHQDLNKEIVSAKGKVPNAHHVVPVEERLDDAPVGRVLDKSGLAADSQQAKLNKEIQRAGMPIIGMHLNHVQPIEKRIDDAPIGRVLDKTGLSGDVQHDILNKEVLKATGTFSGMKLNHVETVEKRIDDAPVGRVLDKSGVAIDSQHQQLNKEIQRAGMPIIGKSLHHVEPVEKHLDDSKLGHVVQPEQPTVGEKIQAAFSSKSAGQIHAEKAADQSAKTQSIGVPQPASSFLDQQHQQINKEMMKATGTLTGMKLHHVEPVEKRIDDAPVGHVVDRK